MNEVSLQQQLNAKASAPVDRKKLEKSGNELPLKANEADADQATNRALAKESERLSSKEEQSIEEAVAQLNDYVQNSQRKLEFQLDEDSGRTVVRVYDKGSEELIRQIPNEDALELAKKLNQEEPLMLFSAQV